MPEIIKSIIEIDIPLPQISGEEMLRKGDFLCENFDVIADNFNQILNNKKFFFTELYQAYLGLAYMGFRYIPLGALTLLWKDEKLFGVCPDCGGRIYITGAGGSPLSGSHSYHGCCISCGKFKSNHSKSFPSIWAPILELAKKYPNKQKILRTKTRFFSWKDGLKGEETPDKILKKKIRGYDVETLIKELRNK